MAEGGRDPFTRRRAEAPGDLDFAWRLYAEAMEPVCSLHFAWNPDEQRRRFERQWRPEETSVLLFDGAPVGWLALREEGNEVKLLQLFIDPAFQGRGLGTRLLRSLMAEAEARGLDVSLEVVEGNRARRLYERLGFAVVGGRGVKLCLRRASRGTMP